MGVMILPTDPVSDYASLHERYYLPLVRLAAQLVDDLDTAEDVVQDVFVALSGQGMPDDPLRYLRTAVVNRARSTLRRRRTARSYLRSVRLVEVIDVSADEPLLRSESGQRLLALVDTLPSRQREVVVLRYYEDLAVAEIAVVLGVSPGAVSSALGRALETLTIRLGADHDH